MKSNAVIYSEQEYIGGLSYGKPFDMNGPLVPL